MADKEQELTRRLFEWQEGIKDLNETLSAINTSMKEGKVTDYVREMIVTILPENPETAQPPHRLYDAEQMTSELMSETVSEQLLLRFRDYFERVQSFYLGKILQIKIELAAFEASKLQKLNEWWQNCNADEREVGYEAIDKMLNSKNAARILVKAKRNERVKLLLQAEKAVKTAREQARQQSEAWKQLSKTEQASVLEAVLKTSGMPANIWWQKATLLERNRVLGKILSTLANVRQDPSRKTEAL